MITTPVSTFIDETRDLLSDGYTLQQAEGYAPGGFTDDELREFLEHLTTDLTPEEREWVERRLEPLHIYDQIRNTAALAATRRAEFDAVDAEQLNLCAAAIAQGHSYTDVAAAAGMSRQVLTKRLQRHQVRLACQAA